MDKTNTIKEIKKQLRLDSLDGLEVYEEKSFVLEIYDGLFCCPIID